jgi:hypothetical protein
MGQLYHHPVSGLYEDQSMPNFGAVHSDVPLLEYRGYQSLDITLRFRLECGLQRLLLYVGGERSTIVPMVRTQLYLMVGTQWLTLWFNLQASSCRRPLIGTINETTGCLFSCLQGVADALPGLAITM